MGKLIVALDLTTPATLFTLPDIEATFANGFFVQLTELSDDRIYTSMFYPLLHKVTVSPVGVPYPGDATPGNGPKKVIILWNNGLANVTHDRCDYVDFSSHWVVLTKGNHLVAYNPVFLRQALVSPS